MRVWVEESELPTLPGSIGVCEHIFPSQKSVYYSIDILCTGIENGKDYFTPIGEKLPKGNKNFICSRFFFTSNSWL